LSRNSSTNYLKKTFNSYFKELSNDKDDLFFNSMKVYLFNHNFGNKFHKDFYELKKKNYENFKFIRNFNYPINNLTTRRLRYLQQNNHVIFMLNWIIENNINSKYFMLLEDDFL
jgi:hypothetical protein